MMHRRLLFFWIFLFGNGVVVGSPIALTDLRCENLVNPDAIDGTAPHFSWKIEGDWAAKQHEVEVQVASDSTLLVRGKPDLWDSGEMQTAASVMVPYGGKPLASRMRYYWRVRITDPAGKRSAWSRVQRFGVGVLATDPLRGAYIGLAGGNGDVRAPLLRKSFNVDRVETSLLHVSSLGYHEVYVNGTKVGRHVLAPAVSQLDKRVWVNTYDVTPHLRAGDNELVIWLGQGWYKKTTFGADYDGPLVKAELGVVGADGWKTVAVTDRSWVGRESGYSDTGTWQALRFGGERIDGRLVPTDLSPRALAGLRWSPVTTVPVAGLAETPQPNEPDVIQEVLAARSIQRLDSATWLVDIGKVITGWFSLALPGLPAGHEVTVAYTDDIGMDPGVAEQGESDLYIASGKPGEVFCNKFNHHAFRYVKISNLVQEPAAAQVKAYLIHGDYRAAASFESSDADLNAIHDMIQYTMRCLTFSGYMVDCPHLERAGYGGDGNSSTQALQTMYDVSPTFLAWLQSWADTMREGGSLPHVAPNPGAGGGGPYWCGFFVMAPWRTYVNYADPRPISRHYAAMKAWLGYVDAYTVDGLLKRWPDLPYRDWYLGDWLAPIGVDAGAQSSVDLVNNCFISECLGALQQIALALGHADEAKAFAGRRAALNALIHRTFFDADTETYATGSQLDMCYPMLVGAVPDTLYERVKGRLIERTSSVYNDHIAVGLVGVPILTEWAVRNKAVDFMHRMLKQPDYPGYLHMINNGATTTWEYWSGERSRVHNCYNGVATWFYQAVGGIVPDERHPGYRHFYVDPQVPEGVAWARTTKETPYGSIEVHWKRDVNRLTVDVTVPIGVEASYAIPGGTAGCSINGRAVATDRPYVSLDAGVHRVMVEFDGQEGAVRQP